jgi:hypothetical protein
MRRAVLYISGTGAEWIGQQSDTDRTPVLAVADLAEESITRVSLPPVRGLARRQLLARRLQQQFADTSYRLALGLGAAASAEATDVLIGVPAQRLDEALRPHLAAGRPISGVWTVTLLVAWWARLSRRAVSHCLVVLPTAAGIRHVLLVHGIPVLTRLVPHELGAAPHASAAQELARTLQYLLNARLVQPSKPLTAWALGTDPVTVLGINVPLAWQTPPAVHGMPDVGSRGVYGLFELLARRAPPRQLAPPSVRLHDFARTVRRSAFVATTVFALAACAGVAERWASAALQGARLEALRSEAAVLQTRVESAQKLVAEAGASPEDAMRRLQAYEAATGSGVPIGQALAALARAFEAAEPYRLGTLQWTAKAAAEDEAAGPSQCTPPAGEAEDGAVARIEGSVAGSLPIREVAQARRRFEAALDHSGVRGFSVVRPPIDVDGATGIASGDGQPRPFSYCVWFGARR